MYRSLVKPEWKTMELLLNTEETIHRVVRLKNPGADPPRLNFTKTGAQSLQFIYNSPRKLSAVARGIIKGVGNHFGQKVTIKESAGSAGSTKMDIHIS